MLYSGKSFFFGGCGGGEVTHISTKIMSSPIFLTFSHGTFTSRFRPEKNPEQSFTENEIMRPQAMSMQMFEMKPRRAQSFILITSFSRSSSKDTPSVTSPFSENVLIIRYVCGIINIIICLKNIIVASGKVNYE